MILKNDTKNDVSVVINGIGYTVETGNTIEVSKEVGTQWKKIHAFLVEVEEVEPTNFSRDLPTTEKVNETDAVEVTKETKETKEVKEVKETPIKPKVSNKNK